MVFKTILPQSIPHFIPSIRFAELVLHVVAWMLYDAVSFHLHMTVNQARSRSVMTTESNKYNKHAHSSRAKQHNRATQCNQSK